MREETSKPEPVIVRIRPAMYNWTCAGRDLNSSTQPSARTSHRVS